MIRSLLCLCCAIILSRSIACAQSIPVTDNRLAVYPFIRPVYNTIQHAGSLDAFYKKLFQVKRTGTGQVSIVHIGDSHIQAGFLPAVVRVGLQQFFGDAGYGLTFPYQLAKSNAPSEIASYSTTTWQFNRLAHPEIPIPYGISGYGMGSQREGASFQLTVKDAGRGFNKVQIFANDENNGSWILTPEGMETSWTVNADSNEIALPGFSNRFTLTTGAGQATPAFYGISVLKDTPGLVYHSIGVNGARYDHYNQAALFWKDLPALKADLYIISLGTNEAQASNFNQPAFLEQVSKMIQQLKDATPEATILITTAADSYKRKKFNTVLKQINVSLASYCEKNSLPFWDLYTITNGYSSAYNWAKRGLMNRDRVHYTAEGYRIQGELLLNALAKGYNQFANRNN